MRTISTLTRLCVLALVVAALPPSFSPLSVGGVDAAAVPNRPSCDRTVT